MITFKTKGSINAYIFGDINTEMPNNMNASRNYNILKKMFPKVNEKQYGFIKSKNSLKFGHLIVK